MRVWSLVYVFVVGFVIPTFADDLKEEKLKAQVPPEAMALLCADQSDYRIRLIDPFAEGDRKPNLWSHPAEDEKSLKYMPTDAKRVEMGGVIYVLASYHGRVQLVRFSDRKVVKDFPSYSSCHSAELLPGGLIVSANSNHGMLWLHRSADDFTDLKLLYAHGSTWDKERQCHWGVGEFRYLTKFA